MITSWPFIICNCVLRIMDEISVKIKTSSLCRHRVTNPCQHHFHAYIHECRQCYHKDVLFKCNQVQNSPLFECNLQMDVIVLLQWTKLIDYVQAHYNFDHSMACRLCNCFHRDHKSFICQLGIRIRTQQIDRIITTSSKLS